MPAFSIHSYRWRAQLPPMFGQRQACWSSIITTRKSSSSFINAIDVPTAHAGSIRILSLNRPAARNAISRQLLSDLSRHIDRIRDEGQQGCTRAVILASEVDECFCAGADLRERASFSRQETAAFLSTLRDTFVNLTQLPIPTITAISSLALGGGLELALATDLRVFASTAQVGLPETRLGIIPGAGGTYRLPALIGMTRAMDLIITGRRVAGLEAFRLGLCDRLVDIIPKRQSQLDWIRKLVLQEAVILAHTICQGAPLAIRAAKKSVQSWQIREAETMAYDEVVGTDDRNEALLAFQEKREPYFHGR